MGGQPQSGYGMSSGMMGGAPGFGASPMGMYGAPQSGYGAPTGMLPGQAPGMSSGMYGSNQMMPGAYGSNPMVRPGMPGVPGSAGLPLSQPPQAPVAQKMYVKTTPIETVATLAATTHISFLWTMMAIVAGAGLAMSCMGMRRGSNEKKKKGDKDRDSSSESESE